jgi:hypothetical protein
MTHAEPRLKAEAQRTLEAVRCSARRCQQSMFGKCGHTTSLACKARMLQKRGFDTVWRRVRLGMPHPPTPIPWVFSLVHVPCTVPRLGPVIGDGLPDRDPAGARSSRARAVPC